MSSQHVVLISGTSSGIGTQTVVAAALAGWRVVATLRDPAKDAVLRAAVDGAGVTDLVDVLPMDVIDPASVQDCVTAVLSRHGRLDAVINNAGAGHVGTLEQETVDDVRRVMEVNFFGVLNLTRAALPHLRATGGRVITVSSVGGVIGQPFNEAYCAAKFAVEGFMEALAPVAGAAGVRVTLVEPGAVASEFVNNVGVDAEAMVTAAGVYGPAMTAYLQRTSGAFANAQSAQDAAAVIVDALTMADPPLRLQTSDVARAFVGLKLADLDGARVRATVGSWVS